MLHSVTSTLQIASLGYIILVSYALLLFSLWLLFLAKRSDLWYSSNIVVSLAAFGRGDRCCPEETDCLMSRWGSIMFIFWWVGSTLWLPSDQPRKAIKVRQLQLLIQLKLLLPLLTHSIPLRWYYRTIGHKGMTILKKIMSSSKRTSFACSQHLIKFMFVENGGIFALFFVDDSVFKFMAIGLPVILHFCD